MKRKSNNDFIEEIKKLVGDEYTPLTPYTTCHVKILMRHNICGHEYWVSPNKFTSQGRRCPKCNGGVRYDIDIVKQEISKITNNEYELASNEYINSSSKINIKHIKCGTIFSTTYEEFTRDYGTRCPKCKKLSKGECIIKSFLEANSIDFNIHYHDDRFKSKNGRRLEFDFYLPNYNLFIEYDGEQHFVPFRDGSDESIRKFKNLQYNDSLKNKLCEEFNIILIRFNYKHTEKQIRDQLKLILKL